MRFLLVLCVLLTSACTKKPPSSDEAKPDEAQPADEVAAEEALPKELQEPTPPADAAPVVKLLDPGEGERSALRLSVAPGSKQQLSVQVLYTAEASVGGTFPVKAPTQIAKYDLTLEAKEKAADGGIRVQVSIDDLSVTQDHRAESKEQRKRNKAVLNTMKKLTGTYTLMPTGQVATIKLDLPPDAVVAAYVLADSLQWALSALMPALPKEPVGEGATWTAHRGLGLGGLHINELSTHELVKRDGTEVQIRTTPLQGGVPQTFKNPGATAELELLEVRSDVSGGDVTWELTSLAPKSATINSKLVTIVQIKEPPKDGSLPMQTFIVTDRSAEVPAP